MVWKQPYTAKTGQDQLEPIYLLLIAEQICESNMNPLTISAVNINISDYWNFEPANDDPLLLYDQDNWELINVGWIDPDTPAADILKDCTRGAYGTQAHAYQEQAMIINPIAFFSTHTISDSDITFSIYPHMTMPSGHTCSLVYQEGKTSIGGVTLEIIDVDNIPTAKFGRTTINGKRAIIMGGYVGMDFTDFEILYSGAVRDFEWENGKYRLNVIADFERLNKTLFGQIEDFDTTLTAGMTAGQTTMTVADDTYAYSSGSTSEDVGGGNYAAIYYRIWTGSNYEDVMDDELGASSLPIIDITRAQLGTTGIIHNNGDEVRSFFSIQDNPVEILLHFLLTGDINYPGQGDYDLYFGATGDESVGVRWQMSDVDVTQFESVRDTWFSSDVYRIDICDRTRMKPFLEQHLLKPMNANLYISRAGKLSLAVISPPIPGADYVTLTESDIVGTPRLKFTNDTIVNNVTVDWEYNCFDDEYANSTISIDATSQDTYDRDGTMTVKARGVHSDFAGSTLASRIGGKKTRNFKNPQALMSLPVRYNKGAQIEPGTVIAVTHGDVPDITTGNVGFNYAMLVYNKKIDWARGTVNLEVIKTNYGQGRNALIAPSGTADYTSASDETKAIYGFISNGTNHRMTNGDEGYSIL